MIDRATTLLEFVAAFETSAARHRHWLREPCLMTDLREAALRDDARRVANHAREVQRQIRRERLWHLENLATARAPFSALYESRRQHFHDLAHVT